MHPAFIDITSAYDAATPCRQALGGTQAAACYLSAALARLGCKVTLINQSREKTAQQGVQSLPPEALDDDATLKNFSALILNGRWTEKLVRSLKKRTAVPLIAFMHEACFQDPYILPCAEFSSFIFVSDWQKKLNAPLIPEHAAVEVIPNGIAPSFQNLFAEDELILATKSDPPVAIYAGSSKRGLLFLPEILPLLHRQHPELIFEIYSDGVIGMDEKENEAFAQRLKALPNVHHLGAIGQEELARRFRRATFLLSPNTYPETFCIVLAEAMAAGLRVIATERAALPETAGGFAALMPIENADDPGWQPHGLDPKGFANFAGHHITVWKNLAAEEKEKYLREQIRFAQGRYSWPSHARNWQRLLEKLTTGR